MFVFLRDKMPTILSLGLTSQKLSRRFLTDRGHMGTSRRGRVKGRLHTCIWQLELMLGCRLVGSLLDRHCHSLNELVSSHAND